MDYNEFIALNRGLRGTPKDKIPAPASVSGRMLAQSTGGTALRLHSCRALSSAPHHQSDIEKETFRGPPVDKPHTRLLAEISGLIF